MGILTIIRLRSLYISIYHYLYALGVEGHWQNDKYKYTNWSGEIRGKQTQQRVWERHRNKMWVVRKMNKMKQRGNNIMGKTYDKRYGQHRGINDKVKHVAYQSRPLPKGLSQRVTFLVVGSPTLHQIIAGNRGPRACQIGLRSILSSWDPSS